MASSPYAEEGLGRHLLSVSLHMPCLVEIYPLVSAHGNMLLMGCIFSAFVSTFKNTFCCFSTEKTVWLSTKSLGLYFFEDIIGKVLVAFITKYCNEELISQPEISSL